MASSSRGSGTLISVLLLVVLAAADAFVVHRLSEPGLAGLLTASAETLASSGAGPALRQAADGGLLTWIAVPILGPLLIALLALLLGPGRRAPSTPDQAIAG